MVLPKSTVTVLLTIVAMIAFAANSVLTRVALLTGAIDAASFSTIRLMAGAATLLVVSSWATSAKGPGRSSGPAGASTGIGGSWRSAAMLFLYAAPFSFAYVVLTTATGALIMFGSVQLTMMVGALVTGDRPPLVQWVGLVVAVAGLVFLLLPGIEAPALGGAALMTLAGFSWGIYSLWGRATRDPLAHTTGNFARSVPFVAVLSLLTLSGLRIQADGVLLAIASGALASGLGYVVWYAALSGLTTTIASVVQLSVPVLAAAGGTLLLSEAVTPRLLVSGAMILGGIALAVIGRDRRIPAEAT